MYDIFLFMNDYIVPLDYEHQILNEFDKAYMNNNNLNVSQMKQIKSLYLIMTRDINI